MRNTGTLSVGTAWCRIIARGIARSVARAVIGGNGIARTATGAHTGCRSLASTVEAGKALFPLDNGGRASSRKAFLWPAGTWRIGVASFSKRSSDRDRPPKTGLTGTYISGWMWRRPARRGFYFITKNTTDIPRRDCAWESRALMD